MRRLLKLAAVLAAGSFLVACSGKGGKITSEGVGNMTFGQETPDPGKGYIAEPATMYFDSDEGFPYFLVKDKSGNRVAEVFPGQSITVYAPDFKTEAGIHPGMNLHEAAKIAGEENLYIWLGWPNPFFTVEDAVTGFSWNVPGDQIVGGRSKFEEISLSGTPVTLAHFDVDAVIESITVVNVTDEQLDDR